MNEDNYRTYYDISRDQLRAAKLLLRSYPNDDASKKSYNVIGNAPLSGAGLTAYRIGTALASKYYMGKDI